MWEGRVGVGFGGGGKKKKESFKSTLVLERHLLVCSFPFFFFVCEVQSIPMRFYAGFNCCVGFSLEPVGCLSFSFFAFFLLNVNSHQSRWNKPLLFFYLIALVSVLIWFLRHPVAQMTKFDISATKSAGCLDDVDLKRCINTIRSLQI